MIKMFCVVVGKVWVFYPVITAYLQLPQKPDWKDKNEVRVYLYSILHSVFLSKITELTPFYLDDVLLAKLRAQIQNEGEVYFVLASIERAELIIPRESELWDLYNFVRTVWSVRSVL